MSRIGRQTIQIPDGSALEVRERDILVKGPKGELVVAKPDHITVEVSGSEATVAKTSNNKQARALHGLTNRLLVAAIQGVTEGFTKTLEIQGVGYRAGMQGKSLMLNVGYSHPVTIEPPAGIELSVQKNTIAVSGIDKQLVGQVAANIRAVRPPEPYKGKGIRYTGEHVRRKAGKAAKAAGAA